MLPRWSHRSILLACAGLFAACSADRNPEAPRYDVVSWQLVSGSLLGPAGNLCASLPPGGLLRVELIDPVAAIFVGINTVTCPANTFAFSAPTGSYLIRVRFLRVADIGVFPARVLATEPVVVDGGDIVRDVTVAAGAPLGGGASFDGAPLSGHALTLVYDQAPGFAAAIGTSGPDGVWVENIGRTPMLLQSGVRLRATAGCLDPFSSAFLGARQLMGPPTGGFLFPDEVAAIDCRLTTAPTVQFSHDRSHLVVTPLPGDIGGLSPELFPQLGAGWGVQLLEAGGVPRHASITASELYRGGLVVGIRPDVVLSGVGLDGYVRCDPSSCRDLGLDGRMSLASSPSFGKQVLWHYSDAPSPEGVGLTVLQKSYDGPAGASYVVFRYTFTNSGRSTVTFYAGAFMDWDVGNVDFDAFDDAGFTDRDGRMMYMTNADGSGPLDGTLVFGAPVSGNVFLTDFGQQPGVVVSALAGDFTNPSVTLAGDHRYVHGVGPITLRRNQSTDVWIAVVSGRDAAEFAANADAATAEVSRHQGDRPDPGGPTTLSVSSTRGAAPRAPDPRCKRGCELP